MHKLIQVTTDEQYEAASKLFEEYARWLKIDLSFQNFTSELTQLKSMYALPSGGIILAMFNEEAVGCIAVRKLENNMAELKRMYVKPAFHKKGIGSALLNEALTLAVKIGYQYIRLDTLDTMLPAISLYKACGFYEIPAYYFNPEINTVYFEKKL